ncbi:MAG: hypothetical protein SWO11_12715, partial [Thermodesulfobacteriota bacterium]|nr:hypothetical protein [Thermodesulfobacteriota bacterium]
DGYGYLIIIFTIYGDNSQDWFSMQNWTPHESTEHGKPILRIILTKLTIWLEGHKYYQAVGANHASAPDQLSVSRRHKTL